MEQELQKVANLINKMFQFGKSRELIVSSSQLTGDSIFNIKDLEAALNTYSFKRSDILFLQKRPVDNFLNENFHSSEILPKTEIQEHLLTSKKTMRINSVWRFNEQLKKLHTILNANFGGEVSINAYYSAQGDEGFAFHYDMCDGVILGLDGVKSWKFLLDKDEEQITRQVDLAPRDVVFIPKGLLHKAKCISEHCLHLSFVFDEDGIFSKFWPKEADVGLCTENVKIRITNKQKESGVP